MTDRYHTLCKHLNEAEAEVNRVLAFSGFANPRYALGHQIVAYLNLARATIEQVESLDWAEELAYEKYMGDDM